MEIIMPESKQVLTILKPDAFLHPRVIINDYLLEIKKLTDKPINYYDIKNWSNVSLYMYEHDIINLNTQDEIIKKRKQLLTTILGYDRLFRKQDALAMFVDTYDPEYTLLILNKIKKELRKKYVSKTDKYFIEYQSEIEQLLSSPLYDIDLDSIKIDLKMYPANSNVEANEIRNMIFFNKIHVPTLLEENEFEKDLLVKKKSLIKRDDLMRG